MSTVGTMRDDVCTCMESIRDVRSVIYDPHGNALTHGEIVDLLNSMADELIIKRQFLQRLLNPEDMGRAVTAYVRNEAREVLGMPRVEENAT